MHKLRRSRQRLTDSSLLLLAGGAHRAPAGKSAGPEGPAPGMLGASDPRRRTWASEPGRGCGAERSPL